MGWLWWGFRVMRRSLAWLLVVLLLLTNVLTLTWSVASTAASAMLGAVGVTTVAAREAGRLAARRTAVRAAARQAVARSRVIATRAVVSLPTKLAPMLGAAAVVGVTAWDLYDTCALAEALTELDDSEALEKDKAAICGLVLPDWVPLPSNDQLPPPQQG